MVFSKLKQSRMFAGVSQRKAAELLHITREHLCNIENLRASLTFEMRVKMARLYGCNPKDLG